MQTAFYNVKLAAFFLCMPLVFMPLLINAETTVDAIKTRPVPQWWQEAKFGIFIHWGVYSVPSYADHDYAEWYQVHKTEGKSKAFHEKVYGSDFTYADFAEQFKVEFFDPDAWANLFLKAGAKYVVLTAKHMEGFTLWKSELANEAHGRLWNSVDIGPKRDIVGELSQSIRKRGMKMGLYFILYEAMTPAYQADPQQFIDTYSIPQLKDLLRTYTPAIVWVDGAWQHTTEEYHSYELLQWALDSLPNADKLVYNNRWGKDDDKTGHGTTEYTYMLAPEKLSESWEECRGIGESFGFNRNEKLEDYSSAQELILMLIDVVSHGGNLLLNIGPTADGRIPVFMQERLLAIGDWLKINGEAIYGSRKYKVTTQWSEGVRKDINPKALAEPIVDGVAERLYILENFNILKLTVNPDEGQAVKEVMFTQKGDAVFAITPAFPKKELIVKHVKPSQKTQVKLLGARGELKWNYKNSRLMIQVPADLVLETGFQYAYTFKISNCQSIRK